MSDTFRKQYRPLSPDRAELIARIKDRAEEVERLMLQIRSREMSLALTNLEQAIMWATKAVVLDDEASNG
jgi:hypothetical protein